MKKSPLYIQSLKSGSNVYYPNGGSGSSIITSFDPASQVYYMKDRAKNSSLINELINTVKEDDNPILLIYNYK